MSDDKLPSNSGFLDKTLDAIPKWAMGVIGTAFGFSLCFIAVMNLADLKPPFSRVVDAYVKRIEKSVTTLEHVAERLDQDEKVLRQHDGAIKDHEKRIQALEARK